MVRPLRVMIDARMLIGRFSGVGRFVTRLVDQLVRQEGLEVVGLCGSEPYAPWLEARNIEVVTSSFSRRDRTAARKLWWEERNLRGLVRRANVDLFHATWNTGIPACCPVPAVLTIHDLIPWSDPRAHFATAAQRWSYHHAIKASARRATMVTTVSRYVRRRALDTLNIDPGRIAAIHNGVDMPADDLVDREPPSRPYALYVGGHESRKNVAGVLRAMRRYWARFDDGLDLELTGQVSSLCPEAAEVHGQLPHKSRVRFLGHVSETDLDGLYRHARVLLMLSHDEGFGLPVLEAMAHGCPVVAASNASLPEVVGDAGLLVNSDDSDAVSDAIHSLVEPSQHREALIQRGRSRAAAFGWNVTAARMRKLYEHVAGETAGGIRPLDIGHPFHDRASSFFV